MVIIKRKRHGINIYEVWKAKEPLEKQGVIQYHQAAFCKPGFVSFRTLITYLNRPLEEIRADFGKTCRNEINRGEREKIRVDFFGKCKFNILLDDLPINDLNDSIINEFLDFFKIFWTTKNIEYNEENTRNNLLNLIKTDSLFVSRASFEGETAVYHVYIIDGSTVRLLYSASLFRNKDLKPALLSIANRFLHYRDMVFFKEAGKEIYDWGGAGLEPEVAAITRFKESFGGKELIEYDGEVAIGIGKIYKEITKLKR